MAVDHKSACRCKQRVEHGASLKDCEAKEHAGTGPTNHIDFRRHGTLDVGF